MKSEPAVLDRSSASTVQARVEQELASLSEEILERYEEVSLVYRLSERLGAVLGQRAVSRLVLEEAAQVLRARGAELWVREDDRIERAATVGVVPPPLHSVDRALHDAVERARVHLQEPSAGTEARLIVPLPSPAGRPIGALVMRGRTDGSPYRTGHVKLLSALATLTSAFLRNHRLAEKAREADLRRRDIDLARQIHRSLLPPCETLFKTVETAGVSFSAEKIGGDCYDYLDFSDGSLGILIADVSGHGVAAAMYMAAVKGALHAGAQRTSDPGELLDRTNAVLAAYFDQTEMFATALLCRVSADGGEWSFSGAGHPAALCLRGDGSVEHFDSAATALGLFAETQFETRRTTLAPEDRLVAYTDGVTEARSSDRSMYGLERLTRIALEAMHGNASALRNRLLDDLESHTDHRGMADDVTLVVAHPAGDRS
jgi:sigma-B regulation protein RsbU (phosphoserine phosphatase)